MLITDDFGNTFNFSLAQALLPSLLSNPSNTSWSIILITSPSLWNPDDSQFSHQGRYQVFARCFHHSLSFPSQTPICIPPNFPDTVHSTQIMLTCPRQPPCSDFIIPYLLNHPSHSWSFIQWALILRAVLYISLHYLISYTTIHRGGNITTSALQMRKWRPRQFAHDHAHSVRTRIQTQVCLTQIHALRYYTVLLVTCPSELLTQEYTHCTCGRGQLSAKLIESVLNS